MIEFTGSYFESPTSKGLSVLVQFDGAELHIWHAPEPFFRIAAFDRFRVALKKDVSQRDITLPNGARIETDDMAAATLIENFGESSVLGDKWWHQSSWMLMALLAGITIIFSAWVFTHP